MTVLLACGLLFSLQHPTAASDTMLASMIRAEYAFAHDAIIRGRQAAFMDAMADDALLMRPWPVNGKKWFTDHPAGGGLLQWYPSRAVCAASGDLGFTTGPWTFCKTDNDSILAAGEFFTIWKRQPDGRWKFILDHGIDVPIALLNEAAQPLQPGGAASEEPVPSGQSAESAHAAVLNSEAEFGGICRRYGIGLALQGCGSATLRVLRAGARPFVGLQACTGVSDSARRLEFAVHISGVSADGTFGYVVGKFTSADGRGVQGNYIHIWSSRDGKTFRLEAEVLTEVAATR